MWLWVIIIGFSALVLLGVYLEKKAGKRVKAIMRRMENKIESSLRGLFGKYLIDGTIDTTEEEQIVKQIYDSLRGDFEALIAHIESETGGVDLTGMKCRYLEALYHKPPLYYKKYTSGKTEMNTEDRQNLERLLLECITYTVKEHRMMLDQGDTDFLQLP